MKVAQVLYSGLGGHAAVAFALASASARRRDWRNSMVFIGIEPLADAHADAAQAAGLVHEAVRTRPGLSWLAWPQLYLALARQRPDAVILHSVKMILPCAMYARFHRIPLFAVEHQANALKRPVEWHVSRWVMRLANRVVVLTDEYRDQLRTHLGQHWREGKVEVIPNGIDTREFAPGARTFGVAPCIVGMAARVTAIKRQDLLLDAIDLLRDRDGPSAWKLTLCGDGDGMPTLIRKVAESGMHETVDLRGHLHPAALRVWFGDLDIYAHASEGETLSTSMLQAMAMGLPIVGSDVAGIGDLLRKGGGVGVTVEQRPEAFAAAFTRIRDDAAFRAKLCARARTMAESCFSEDAMADRYAGLLEAACTR